MKIYCSSKESALFEAKRQEKSTGESRWVLKCVAPSGFGLADCRWLITDKIPLLGECYDTNGSPHG